MVKGDVVLWCRVSSIGAGHVTEVHEDYVHVAHVGYGCGEDFRPDDLLLVSDVLDVLDAHEFSGDCDGPFGAYCPSCDEEQRDRGPAKHKPDCKFERIKSALRRMVPGWPKEGGGHG